VFSRRCSWTVCAAGSDKLAIVPAPTSAIEVNISAALSSSANPYDANSAANKSVATKLLY
jgi:hypothetical protein